MNWETAASLATAGGTMLLAVATFASVRSGNRSARFAEQSVLAAVRPLVVSSRFDDPEQEVVYREGHIVHVPGGHAAVDVREEATYLAISVRNVSQGVAVLDSWWVSPDALDRADDHADLRNFTRVGRDLFVPAGGMACWLGALRDRRDPKFEAVRAAVADRRAITIDLLYGDHLGGQRAIVRFAVRPEGDDRWLAASIMHWTLDRSVRGAP